MIVVDTSALVAILLNEPERVAMLRELYRAKTALISVPTVLEARMVIQGRKGQAGVLVLNEILAQSQFEIVPPSTKELESAYAAFVVYGKGGGHPASLNFGDLFSYALAKTRNLPLLCKGNDFKQTDLRLSVP